jgi:hypothetical protein
VAESTHPHLGLNRAWSSVPPKLKVQCDSLLSRCTPSEVQEQLFEELDEVDFKFIPSKLALKNRKSYLSRQFKVAARPFVSLATDGELCSWAREWELPVDREDHKVRTNIVHPMF